jgi:hypothetical protein
MRIDVQIERLVLDGLPVTSLQIPMLRQAMELELARLLKTHGLSQELRQGGAMPRVKGGALQLAGDNPHAQLGRWIARAVHEAIGGAQPGGGRR